VQEKSSDDVWRLIGLKKNNNMLEIDCEEAKAFASRKLDKDLPIFKRFKLMFHCMACGNCSNYLKELKFIKLIMKIAGKKKIDLGIDKNIKLSGPKKASLQENINQHLKS